MTRDPDPIDAMLTRHFRATQDDADAGARVLRRLSAAKLPPQISLQRRGLRWPALFDLDFSPVWLRVAVLAGCTALGFIIGLAGVDAKIDEASATATAAVINLPLLANDIEPLTRLRP